MSPEELFFYGLIAVILGLGIPLIILSVIRLWMSHKALKLYAKHIKVTMNLPEVRRFIEKTKKPFIEVDEDKSSSQVIVIWRDSMKRDIYPSVWVYVDKNKIKPLKIVIYSEDPHKKPSTRTLVF